MGDTEIDYPVEGMVDIETMDTEDTAIVFQVGLILFAGPQVIAQRQWNLDMQEQIDSGRTMSADTLKFHLSIPTNLSTSMHVADTTVQTFTEQLKFFVRNEPRAKYWWAKGDMDFAVLKNLLGADNLPWVWYNKMELRTLIRETGAAKPEPAHSALSDCIMQHAQLMECRGIIDGATRSESEEGDQQGSTQADTE